MNENSLAVYAFIYYASSQGTGSAYSKGSRLTTVDRGVGYDASDSFIDDTEAVSDVPEFLWIFFFNFNFLVRRTDTRRDRDRPRRLLHQQWRTRIQETS